MLHSCLNIKFMLSKQIFFYHLFTENFTEASCQAEPTVIDCECVIVLLFVLI